jgi:hypothetical protein
MALWKNISLEGYSTRYRISEYGEIEHIGTSKRLKHHVKCGSFTELHVGYLVVDLIDDRGIERSFLLHFLVATTFLPRVSADKTCVLHKDSRIRNNHFENLKWCSEQEYPDALKLLQLSEPFHIRKYVRTGALFDIFNDFADAAASTRFCLTPIDEHAIKKACKTDERAGVWYWSFHMGSRLPLSPLRFIEELQNTSFARQIEGFPDHLVTTDGHIYSKITGLPVQQLISPSFNYPIVYLPNHIGERKMLFTHHIVANTFIPRDFVDPEARIVINHIDHNKHNPAMNNLEWVTNARNIRAATYFYFFHCMKANEFYEIYDEKTGYVKPQSDLQQACFSVKTDDFVSGLSSRASDRLIKELTAEFKTSKRQKSRSSSSTSSTRSLPSKKVKSSSSECGKVLKSSSGTSIRSARKRPRMLRIETH